MWLLSPGRGAELSGDMRAVLTVLLCGLLVGSAAAVRGCALLSSLGHHTQYQVTDGRELLISTWDSGSRLVSCSVQEDPDTVSSSLSRCLEDRQGVGWDSAWFAGVREACYIFLGAGSSNRRADTMEKHTRVKRGFTYPGTLWCGAGNNADKDTDLGEHKETDSCCRTHDHCEDVIHPFTVKYGYRNFRWHTISHCQCDNRFKDCLRKVNDTASRVVGQAFFNVIQVQCFDFTLKEQCVERHWLGWCQKYKNETTAVARDSGLYDYGGNLIDQLGTPTERDLTQHPTKRPPLVQSTVGQVIQATENVLKIMVTLSPSTSSDLGKVEPATKKKKDRKKKERKNKKGKGLKGKKKKVSPKDDKTSSKDVWDEHIVKSEGIHENQALDTMLEIGHKEDPFNDVLNDDPNSNAEPGPISPTSKSEERKGITSPQPALRPATKMPHKKNRRQRKERAQKRKKPNTESIPSVTIQ